MIAKFEHPDSPVLTATLTFRSWVQGKASS